ncbi:hypothetical protein A7985_11630 [Pseudoalteromonas luteoviolacea]|uniref:Uncharacterized protein n=1 Tax=Pseudoalteromonas luteoviolacea TaxID=43657 RepID=A0A1C0TQT4_9GAMM|nr:hypothetical protein [Pseudoalteromonas luteoviolacea]MBQ4811514.1 hypothetical protein [Pseudoalteromonas luteoviolacea]OCQ21270.1 hypothetical protein A7985_11630 [Pseudoalteromonas luteoviolacea]
MIVDTFLAKVTVKYRKRHSEFPEILLGENTRFDIDTDEGKVIANLYDMEKAKLNIGEQCEGSVSARWIGGMEKSFLENTSLPILVIGEEIGEVIIHSYSVERTEE